jgi:chromosomal replication initiator protein
MLNSNAVWQATLGELQLQMTKATFDTWVKQTHVLAYEDGAFIVGVQNGYAKDWLENRLLGTIKRTLSGILNRSVEVKFVVQSQAPGRTVEAADWFQAGAEAAISGEAAASAAPKPASGPSKFAMIPQYTFDHFVVGGSNRLAHAASLAVAENPARAYNPLFLYGGVGLGKTHLMQAIGHHAVEQGYKVLYLSSETFTNDLINAIRTKSTETFRDCYRNADFLLVDDIQFIAGKESTQEEFFHTFNALHSSERQVVLTSDRPPQAIPTLEERLASRFQWGLIADIQPPDLETRIAILRVKAEARGARLPTEVTDFIARQMQSNIRELEGGLNRVLAHASLTREPITLELARHTLSNLVDRRERIALSDIIEAVAHHYGIAQADLTGTSRQKEFVTPRQIVMYLAREETNASFPIIGQALGGRDHTTVLHGSQKMAAEIERNDALRRDLVAIRQHLYREPA